MRSNAAATCILCLFAAAATPAHAAPGCESIAVVLIGTGTPDPDPERAGPGTLVQANGQNLLFDVGRYSVPRLVAAGVKLDRLDRVFLTHLHSDHVSDLPDLLLTSRIPGSYGGRTLPLGLTGPPGTIPLARGIEQAFQGDVVLRATRAKLAKESATFDAREFEQDGVVYERDGVTVRAFEVAHGFGPRTAYGFRIDCGKRSVVISGDTSFDERIIRMAEGVDILVHEVVGMPARAVQGSALRAMIQSLHTTPEQAAEVFRRAHPRIAVYTHVLLQEDATEGEIVARTRASYAGPLVLGADLTRIEVGDDVRVVPETRVVKRGPSQAARAAVASGCRAPHTY